jgi:hypothetical protein
MTSGVFRSSAMKDEPFQRSQPHRERYSRGRTVPRPDAEGRIDVRRAAVASTATVRPFNTWHRAWHPAESNPTGSLTSAPQRFLRRKPAPIVVGAVALQVCMCQCILALNPITVIQ